MTTEGGGEAPRRKRAMLLMLDGTRPDALLAADAPHLKKLAFQGGAFSFHVNCGGLPLSAPCWTTILTGVSQDSHQVTSNDLDYLSLDAEGRVLVSPVPECLCGLARKPLCGVFRKGKIAQSSVASPLPTTVFERLAAAGRHSALLSVGSWEGVMRLCGVAPGVAEAVAQGGHFSARHFASELDAERAATQDAVAAAEALLARPDCPDLVAIYLHLIDGNGHAHGFGYEVESYRAAIEFVDGQVGRLIRAAEARGPGAGGRAEEWLFAVTTDHGGTAQRRMPRSMREAFRDCGCVQLGIPQTGLRGVHGLREITQHSQTFQILRVVPSGALDSGEMLPAPEPEDLVPTLLQHLGVSRQGLAGTPRGLLPEIPEVPPLPPDEPPSFDHQELTSLFVA